MANVEWDVAQTIISPYATLELNQVLPLAGRDDGFYYLVKADNYQIVPGKFRPVSDSISQADGSSLQPPYIDGLVATLTVEYWVAVRGDAADLQPACGEDLRLMNQMLMGVLNSLRVYSSNPGAQQRYLWAPTGYGDHRMLIDILLASWPTPHFFGSDGIGAGVSFSLATPFPYAIDATEIDTSITEGSYAAVTNAGNAAQSPVVVVSGPCTDFVIENMETGQLVSYNSLQPGWVTVPAGHTVTVDFFAGSAVLSGGAGTDVIAGLDPTVTDFWTLAPDTTSMIYATGADMLVKSNNAWV